MDWWHRDSNVNWWDNELDDDEVYREAIDNIYRLHSDGPQEPVPPAAFKAASPGETEG